MTWADILAEVRLEIQESTASVWTDAEFLDYCNKGCRLICALTGWYQQTANLVPVVGQQDYTFPSNISRLLRATWDRNFLPQSTQSELDKGIGNWRGAGNNDPERFFIKQWDTFSSYPKPRTAGASVTFTAAASGGGSDDDFGTIVQWQDPSGTPDPDVTFDSEFGIVIAMEDTEGGQVRFEHDPVADPLSGTSQELGVETQYSTDEDNFGLYYEALPDNLVNTTDIPQMPSWVQPALVPFIVFCALRREGPMQDLEVSAAYFGDFGDWMSSVLEKQHRQWPEKALNLSPVEVGSEFTKRFNEIGAGNFLRTTFRAHYE